MALLSAGMLIVAVILSAVFGKMPDSYLVIVYCLIGMLLGWLCAAVLYAVKSYLNDWRAALIAGMLVYLQGFLCIAIGDGSSDFFGIFQGMSGNLDLEFVIWGTKIAAITVILLSLGMVRQRDARKTIIW